MSLFFKTVLSDPNNSGLATSVVHLNLSWHNQFPILAVGAYSEDKGGFVSIFEQGSSKTGTSFELPSHPTAQVTSLAWHPEKKILAAGWDNGDLTLNQANAESLHQAPVNLLAWSSCGSRLVSADKAGSVVGWDLSSADKLLAVFHHELKDPLVDLTFRDGGIHAERPTDPVSISSLAKAAVAGDEKALDLFSNSWRSSCSSLENLNLYVGSEGGVVYYLNENGNCMEVLQTDGPVKSILLQSDILVIVTDNMVIGQFDMEEDGTLNEISKVKLSSRTKENQITWCGLGVLAISSGDVSVRIWNIRNDENYVLSESVPSTANIFVTSISFSYLKRILIAGTSEGHIYLWQYDRKVMVPEETDWKMLPKVLVGQSIKDLSFGSIDDHLAINTVRQVLLLQEQVLSAHYFDGMSALQVAPSRIKLAYKVDRSMEIDANFQVKGCFVIRKNFVIWGADKVITYEIQKDIGHSLKVGEFNALIVQLVASENSIYTLEDERNKINVRSYQGTIKQSLMYSEIEGMGLCISVTNGLFLITGTSGGFVKVWDLDKREARPHVHPLKLSDLNTDIESPSSVEVNSTGIYVSFIASGSSNSKLYILEVENNHLRYFNVASARNEINDSSVVPPNSASENEVNSTSPLKTHHPLLPPLTGRKVLAHKWDVKEPHLLVCLTGGEGQQYGGDTVICLFLHDDFGIVLHDVILFSPTQIKLLSSEIPYIVVIKEESNMEVEVYKKVMKDFEGLESCDPSTKDAVISFSFFLSAGNMDEAFKAIQSVDNPRVWENLARMCVQTQRLDVAVICLGNMKHAHGARAVRKAMARSDLNSDAKTAYLAVHLGMLEEAEKLLKLSGRNDILNSFYQDSSQWNNALKMAESSDRMHLRSTYYAYAKHLEKKGDIAGAIQNYEKSGTHQFEVPRLLLEDWNVLESYILKSSDKGLKRWWAQYMESTGEMEVALRYYDLAQDYLSLVRVYCYCDNLEKASEIAKTTKDRAACYHLARQYENIDDIESAVHFFSEARAYSNAIRICKEQGFSEKLWNLALLAPCNEKLEAARYFERSSKPSFYKAVILYEKSGYLGKALDLAIATNQHSALKSIVQNLNESTDPNLLAKAGDFFLKNEQYEKAVELFAASGKVEKAVDLCLEYNINITEELEQKFSAKLPEVNKQQFLNKLAEVCYTQGSYHLATKKWTQAGNRLQAMKALLKSGDTEKIIFFANVSREKNIYILAGNYLQTIDWRSNGDIMKHIISFYSKSKSYDLLAWFYKSCSEVEIDEYQNYEKSAGALAECLKCLDKCEQTVDITKKIEQVKKMSSLVNKFSEIQKKYSILPNEAIEACKELLKLPDLEIAVRRGDVYGFIVEHYARNSAFKAAYSVINEMTVSIPNANLGYYINAECLRAIDQSMGTNLATHDNDNHSTIEEDE